MKLGQLTGGNEVAPVTGFAIDHRKVAPGTIFGAFQGARVNGEDYIADAIRSGAVAIVARPGLAVEGATYIADANPRERLARLAAAYFAPFPAHAVAVTGTNGKTSCVEMTRQLWRMAGYHAASIGTLGVTTADDRTTTGLTTPDVVTFLSNVAGLAREGVTHLAFEASSHGLTQYRTEGLKVEAAAFTNLSRDHLDYHGDMAAYLTAKLRLFSEVLSADGTAVVWADDREAARVIDLAHARSNRLITVGTRGETLRLVGRDPTLLGQGLTIEAEGRTHQVQLPLIGAYQAANALVSAGLGDRDRGRRNGDVAGAGAVAAGARAARARGDHALRGAGLCRLCAYPRCARGRDRGAEAACGGPTDRRVRRRRRPRPGQARGDGPQVATTQADRVIVTDDNPRSEDPAAIRSDVLRGARTATEIGDRRAAIAAALREAGAEDIVLIAGKGHEQGQVVGNLVLPFDDVAVARECVT